MTGEKFVMCSHVTRGNQGPSLEGGKEKSLGMRLHPQIIAERNLWFMATMTFYIPGLIFADQWNSVDMYNEIKIQD